MLQSLLRISAFLVISVIVTNRLAAQDTTRPTSIDPKLIEWETARIPKEYRIAEVKVTGIRYLDSTIVLSISALQVGDKFTHPGSDIFSKAINNLWRQKLFSNIQVYVTKIVEDDVSIEIAVTEMPKLGNFKFVGAKKTEAEEMQGKMGLAKQTIYTENTRRTIREVATKYYREKGFQNISVPAATG